ncbi:SOUL family heme-binding protein [Francisella adeliensis]|uniref:Heme-binding protein n=1 Tax=Francisella adeliensis TaxID=2007306 RepID=A0A2Z4XWE8_9GAMM|nr:heme-binding protein [Francisella adeliensis]AXA33181.1 SOUL heme-binding protein [Francisella adeliensis]MBK2085100.1 heme-binding protein [Francisella adeliensis]MBK2096909.1 heme-binding protein [Francisella adeliensis]QIW11409.1 heme-binding protein [Francisella adeliensis]QIW13284.1 heme-binding protein [Francisella adeliensis]
MFKKISALGLSIALSSCSVIGINNTPQAKYQDIKKDNNFSVRVYEPVVEAQVTIEGKDYKSAINKGFRELFKYITGSNISKQKISMTAPVITEQKSQDIEMTAPVLIKNNEQNNSWTITFVMPAKMTLENAPKPTNKEVKLVEKPKTKVAVIEFNGYMDKQSIEVNTKKLKNWIASNNLEIIDRPQAAGYNPPWTIPFLRKNEVIIPVK